MHGSIAGAARIVGGVLLIVMAIVLVLMAFRERDLAATLDSLVLPGAKDRPPGTGYELGFWIHLFIAAGHVGVAVAVMRLVDRIWFALAALISALAAASGWWAMQALTPSTATNSWAELLPIALLVVGGLAVLASLIGWFASPPLAPVRPSIVIVSSNHQA